MPLPVPVVFHNDEPCESLCDRLSAANAFSSARQFLSLAAINPTAVNAGSPSDVQRLAHWSGQEPDALLRYRIGKSNGRLEWRLGAALFNRQARRGRIFRYCPNCVADDLDNGSGRPISRAYVRVGWTSRVVKTCIEHMRPIVETAVGKETGDSFCRFVAANISTIRKLAEADTEVALAEVDAYAEDRIRGKLREPYLDQFEAHVAIDLCRHIGSFVKRHPSAMKAVPVELRSAPAREIGFQIARQGEQAMRDLVAKVAAAERPNGTAKFIFGALGRWLRTNANQPEFTELTEFFQDVAVRNLPYGVGETCFVRVQRRYVHSVISAMAEYGLHDDRTVQLLLQAGLITDASVSLGRIHFDADKAHPILDAASQTITSREARERLGISERVMTNLLNRAVIPRVEERDSVRIYTRIRVEDVEIFRSKLFARVMIGVVPTESVSVTRVCQGAGCDTADVIMALLDGRLKHVFAAPGHDGSIWALCFDLERSLECLAEDRKTLSAVVGVPVLNLPDAAVRMAVKSNTIGYLIRLGLLEPMTVRNQVNKRQQAVVTTASIEEFQRNHIRLSEVAVMYEAHPGRLIEYFAKVGIKPIYDNCGTNVSRFFRRTDIENAPVDIPRFSKR